MRKLRTVTVGTLVAVAALMTIGLAVRNAQAGPAPAPAVVGDWNGTLDTGSGTMKVVVHIAQDKDAKLNATLDSPDQGAAAMGIPISLITYKDSALHFEIAKMGAGYDGIMNKDNSQIAGDWKQGGGSLPLSFNRATK